MQEYKGEWYVIMWKRDKSKANTEGLQQRERERVRDWEERMVGHRSVPPTNFIRALAFVLFLSNPRN